MYLIGNGQGGFEGGGFVHFDLVRLYALRVEEDFDRSIQSLPPDSDLLNGVTHPSARKKGTDRGLDSLERLGEGKGEKQQAKEWIHRCAYNGLFLKVRNLRRLMLGGKLLKWVSQARSSGMTFPPSTISMGRSPGAMSSLSATIPIRSYTVVAKSSTERGFSSGAVAKASEDP